MCWHPLETDLRSAGDQLVHYRPDFQHEILSSAGGIGTDGGECRPGITTDYCCTWWCTYLTSSHLHPFHQPGGVGMKGSVCCQGTVQSRSLDQVGDQVADGGTVGDTGGASEGPTHLFDSGVIYSLTAEHILSSHKLDLISVVAARHPGTPDREAWTVVARGPVAEPGPRLRSDASGLSW